MQVQFSCEFTIFLISFHIKPDYFMSFISLFENDHVLEYVCQIMNIFMKFIQVHSNK